MKNAIHWFEIPVTNLDRAVKFYSEVLEVNFKVEVFGGMHMAVFLTETHEGIGGALIVDAKRNPSQHGTLPYLNATAKLSACLDRVQKAGGNVIMQRTDIGDPGFIGQFEDTEGNIIGLHEPK